MSGVYGKQSRQDIQLFLGFNNTRPVAFLAHSGGLSSLSSFLSFLHPFFPYASRLYASQAVSHGWCAVFASLGFWRLFCWFVFLSPPYLLECAPLLVPVRRWLVVCWFVLLADQGSPLVLSEFLQLAVCPALRPRQSCQPDSLFMFFT